MTTLHTGLGSMAILPPEDIEQIIKAAKTILMETGAKILDDQALDILKRQGFAPTGEGLVKMPPAAIDQALASAPKQIVIYDRDGAPAMNLGSGRSYFGSLTNCLEYIDPENGQARPVGSKEERIMVRLSDALPNIDFAMNSGTLNDCEHGYPGAEAFAIVTENTSKPIGFTTNDFESCVEAVELATALAGGEAALARRPFLIHYAEPISPLLHNADSCRKLRLLAEKSVPVTYTPYTMMGGTAPMSFAANLSLVMAEVFSGLVLHQTIRPGAPFIMGAMPSYLEMRHSIGVMGAPEFHLLIAAAAEIAHSLGFPFFGTAGCSDAPCVDIQAAVEATMSIMSSLLSKADLVHDLGMMGHGESTSPEMLVLSNELIGCLAPFRKGVEVSEESLALRVIDEVGPGGHFLTHRHTLANFRTLYSSKLFDRTRSFMSSTMEQRVKEATLRLIETPPLRPLSPEKAVILAAFRKKWRHAERR